VTVLLHVLQDDLRLPEGASRRTIDELDRRIGHLQLESDVAIAIRARSVADAALAKPLHRPPLRLAAEDDPRGESLLVQGDGLENAIGEGTGEHDDRVRL